MKNFLKERSLLSENTQNFSKNLCFVYQKNWQMEGFEPANSDFLTAVTPQAPKICRIQDNNDSALQRVKSARHGQNHEKEKMQLLN